MRGNDDVDRSVRNALLDQLRFLRRLEPRERLNPNGERREPRSERLLMLAHQQCRRHEHGHLLALLDRLKRSSHRDLGLSVPNVATHDPVHRHGPLHVCLDLIDRGELIWGFNERERVLEFGLPRGVRAERITRRVLAYRVQPHELACDLAYSLARASLCLRPVATPEAVHAR